MNIAIIANATVYHREVSDILKRQCKIFTFTNGIYSVKTTNFIRATSVDEVYLIEFDGFVDLIQKHDLPHYFDVQEYFKKTYHKEYYIDEIGGISDKQHSNIEKLEAV